MLFGLRLFSLPVFLPLSLFIFDYLPLGFLPSIISLYQTTDDYDVIIISDNSGDEGKSISLLSLSLPLQVSFEAFAETSVFIKQTLCKEYEIL